MYKRFSQLSFVIGLFFSIVAVILFVNALMRGTLSGINLYTSIVFILFGLVMMLIKSEGTKEHS